MFIFIFLGIYLYCIMFLLAARSPCRIATQSTATTTFSVPGAEQLQKLLSVGPQGYISSKNCSKSNGNP